MRYTNRRSYLFYKNTKTEKEININLFKTKTELKTQGSEIHLETKLWFDVTSLEWEEDVFLTQD